jgi:hypothetical protein
MQSVGDIVGEPPSTLSGSFLLVFVTANDESAAVIADPQKLTISKMTRY